MKELKISIFGIAQIYEDGKCIGAWVADENTLEWWKQQQEEEARTDEAEAREWIAVETEEDCTVTEKRGGVEVGRIVYRTLEEALDWIAFGVAREMKRSLADVEPVYKQVAPDVWKITVNQI